MQEEVFTYPLGQHTTVFQAELFAILACMNEPRLTNKTSRSLSARTARLHSRLYGDQKSRLDWYPPQVYGLVFNSGRTKKFKKSWRANSGCRQAKVFIDGPDKQLTRFALGML